MNPNPSPETRFQPGQSGNPAGRPPGSRNAALVEADAIIDQRFAAVVEATCRKAEEGSERAQALIFRSRMPAARQRPVVLELPELDTIDDILAAHGEIVRRFAAGEITAEDARHFSELIEAQRRSFEAVELARRLEAVEEALGLDPG